MDAHYDSQIKSHNPPIAQQSATFCGPARQMGAGAGGLGAFAMRMGRVAIPVVRKYILPVAKHMGKNLLEAAIPEIGQVFGRQKKAQWQNAETCCRNRCREKSPKIPVSALGRSAAAGGADRRASGSGGRRAGPQVSPNRGRTAQVEGDATLFVHHHPRHLCLNHRRQSFPKENP